MHELESKSDEDFPSENVRVYREGSDGPGKHRQTRVLHGPGIFSQESRQDYIVLETILELEGLDVELKSRARH